MLSSLDVLTPLLTTCLFITWLGVVYAHVDPGTIKWDAWHDHILRSSWIKDMPAPVLDVEWILIFPPLIIAGSFSVATSL